MSDQGAPGGRDDHGERGERGEHREHRERREPELGSGALDDGASPEEAARLRAALAGIAAIDLGPARSLAGTGLPSDGTDEGAEPLPVLQLVPDTTPGARGPRRSWRRRLLLPAAALLAVAALGTVVVANRPDRDSGVGIPADGRQASGSGRTRLIARAVPSDLQLMNVSDEMMANEADGGTTVLLSDPKADGRPGRLTVMAMPAGDPAATTQPPLEVGGAPVGPSSATTVALLNPDGSPPTASPSPPAPTANGGPQSPPTLAAPPPTLAAPPTTAATLLTPPPPPEHIARNGRDVTVTAMGSDIQANVRVDECQISVFGSHRQDVVDVAATVGCERRNGTLQPVVEPPAGYRSVPQPPRAARATSLVYLPGGDGADGAATRSLEITVLDVEAGTAQSLLETALPANSPPVTTIGARTVHKLPGGGNGAMDGLVWAEGGNLVVSVQSVGITASELEALVDSVEVVDEATWQQYASTAKNPSPSPSPSANATATTVACAPPAGAGVPPSLRLVPAKVPEGGSVSVHVVSGPCASGGAASAGAVVVLVTDAARSRFVTFLGDAGGGLTNNKSGATPGRSVRAGERTLVFLEGGVPTAGPVAGSPMLQAVFDTPGGTVSVNAVGYSEDEVVALVAGMRPASEEEWAQLLASAGDGAMVVATGSVTAGSGMNGYVPIPTTTAAGR